MRLHAIQHFYSNRLGMVRMEDDVLSIVRQVRDLYGDRVTVELDEDTGWFHFVGHENDTDYLIFSTEALDPRALTRLLASDIHQRGYVDSYDEAEKEQDRLQAELDEKARERLNEQGERLIHAIKKDDLDPHLPLIVPIPRGFDDAA